MPKFNKDEKRYETLVYLLKGLLLIMAICLFTVTFSVSHGPLFSLGHIELAIFGFIFVIFIQAFVMFYFIGISRLAQNVANVLQIKDEAQLRQFFDSDHFPEDLSEYRKKCGKFVYDSTLYKRKIIPWTMLVLTLGSLSFLLGGAYDTGVVTREYHIGPVYGFLAASALCIFHQWRYLTKNQEVLRKLKELFQLPRHQM